MTSGGLTALLLTAFMELTGPRRVHMQTPLEVESLPAIQQFLKQFAGRKGLGSEVAGRPAHAAEETLLLLIEEAEDDQTPEKKRLRLTARADAGAAEVEFLAASVQHHKYADTDVVTVRVAPTKPEA